MRRDSVTEDETSDQMEYPELAKTCRDCDQPFIISAGEHAFFDSKGLNLPVRCKACRAAKRAWREGAESAAGENRMQRPF